MRGAATFSNQTFSPAAAGEAGPTIQLLWVSIYLWIHPNTTRRPLIGTVPPLYKGNNFSTNQMSRNVWYMAIWIDTEVNLFAWKLRSSVGQLDKNWSKVKYNISPILTPSRSLISTNFPVGQLSQNSLYIFNIRRNYNYDFNISSDCSS